MSVHYDAARKRYVVHWREQGRQRKRRFRTEADARAFDSDRQAPIGPEPQEAEDGARGDGIYGYTTADGTLWRFVFRQSDGRLSSRRGFPSRRAAATARRRMLESVERGEMKVARETFGEFWAALTDEKRRYLTPGAHQDLLNHGRKRLLPYFADMRISDIEETAVREWLAAMVDLVEAGELAPKTVNNARTCLSVALKEATRRGLLTRNPCDAVRQLPITRAELDYLRLPEITPYLEACPGYYRPLAEFLIGTGARISEALAVRVADVELDQGVVRIYRQRAATASGTAATKGKRFRSVQMGPALVGTLRALIAADTAQRQGWLFLCPVPRRGRYARRDTPTPPSRHTVHGWHEAALQDAGLRDMPLHALRHTAAAAWLTTGHPLIFVQRQLGHRSITTTEEHYGHLEASVPRRRGRGHRGGDHRRREAPGRVNAGGLLHAAVGSKTKTGLSASDPRGGNRPAH